MNNTVNIIGIAGASGSGKTLVSNLLKQYLGNDKVTTICVDSYYKGLPHLPLEQRLKSNFDHPDSLEIALLKADLEKIKQGKTILVPEFEYSTCLRKKTTTIIEPKPLIIVEGILLLALKEILPLLNFKIYVDCPLDLALLRRISRDIIERNNTVESSAASYKSRVRPMFFEFVEPSKLNADLIITNDNDNFTIDIKAITALLNKFI